MRVVIGGACAVILAVGLVAGPQAQGGAPGAAPQGGAPGGGGARGGGRQGNGGPDVARVIPGGGISVPGWVGKVDSAEIARDATLSVNSSKLAMEGGALHVTTGPATTYWNPNNKATGTYTVKATFTEPKFQEGNSHAHPYGIMVAGNDLGTPQQSYVYCAAYGNGMFIMRGFGPSENPAADAVYNLNGRGAAHDAVHKAAAVGQPVTQDIAVTVKADSVDCLINGTVVGTYPKTDLVQPGRLKSTDGIYGIRFAHNTDATVTGLTMTK